MDWYSVWQENHLFKVEKNLLKKKRYIYTPCIKVNQNGFENAAIRNEIYADALARYFRYKGENVMYTPTFDTLCYSSFMESKIENNELNDELFKVYNEELVALDIGYSFNKALNLRNNESLLFIQKLFLFLYKKGVIKYGKKRVLYDSNKDKIYDGIETDFKESTKSLEVFSLDIEPYIPKFLENAKRLGLPKDIMDLFIQRLLEEDLLDLSLYTEGDFEFDLILEHPEYLGSLGALVLNPDFIDVLDYVAPEEIFAVENFLETKKDTYLFTGSSFINPLNGKRVPIFISYEFKEAKKPLFGYYSEDLIILKSLGITPDDIIVDGLLINSDFLNNLEPRAAHKEIINSFTKYDMGKRLTKFLKKDILISSLDKYGCPFPLMTSRSGIITLDEHLPLSFSNRFRIVIPNEGSIPSEYHLFNSSINSLFLHGLLPFMTILYEKNLEIDDPLSEFNLNEVKNWLKQSALVINRKDVIYDLFMPLMLLTIIEANLDFSFEINSEIIYLGGVYDAYGNELKKEYNNLIRLSELAKTYGSDALRLYYLDNNKDQPLYFDKDNIFSYKQFLLGIDALYQEGFLESNFSLEFPFYQFKNKAMDAMYRLDLADYVKAIFDFVKGHEDLKLTKKQGLEFLIILSIVAPDLAETLHYRYFSKKELLIDYGWML